MLEALMKQININNISIPERIRGINKDEVAKIAHSISEAGQLQPILVRGENGHYYLIDGAHRLEACKSLGMDEIKADIVEMNMEQAKLAEIDANLMRHELNAFDRANFLTERKEIWEQIYGKIHGGDRRGDGAGEQLDMFAKFDKETRGIIGLSTRTIQRDIATFQALGDDTKAHIQGSYLAQKQGILRKLAEIGDKDMQAEVARVMVERPKEFKQPHQAIKMFEFPNQYSIDRQEMGKMGHKQKATRKQYFKLLNAWYESGDDAKQQFMQMAGLRLEHGINDINDMENE